ncbi:unnamed protein product [Ilex paraguariensis]|uniref:Uncharacterized protein n=1 Tax=Ilex paraguariensis TaxID=185542 RepID=A0ABC8UY25_9AQUA
MSEQDPKEPPEPKSRKRQRDSYYSIIAGKTTTCEWMVDYRSLVKIMPVRRILQLGLEFFFQKENRVEGMEGGQMDILETQSQIVKELEFLAVVQKMMFEALLPNLTYQDVPPPPLISQPSSLVPPSSMTTPPYAFVTKLRGDVHEIYSSESKEEGEYESEVESE